MHACMLDEEPKPPCIRPLSSIWRRMNRGGTCCLPCSWHHSSKWFLSQKGLQIERERQLNSGHWFSIHPYSPFKFYWDIYIMLVYFASLSYLPLQVFIPCSNRYDQFVLFCDAMGFLYICFNFVTGIVDEDGKNVNLKRSHIAKKYLKDSLLLDVLSALPLQLIPLQLTICKFPTHTVFFVFKFFRIIPCGRVWMSLAVQFRVTYMWSTSAMILLRFVFFFHWMTFIHYQVPVYLAHYYEHEGMFKNWLIRFKVEGPDSTEISQIEKYVSNLYLVTGLCIGAGFHTETGSTAQLPAEQLFTAILSLIGLIYVTYFMTNLLRLIIYRNYDAYIYYGLLKELHEYLKFKLVPQRLCQKIQLYINCRFNGHYFNQNSILNTLNVQIKQEINMYHCKNLLINVPLFQDMPIALINTIIFSLKQVLYMPGEVVVHCGHPGSSLYLIASGTVAIMDAEGKEVAHLKDGAFFGEKALLQPGLPRSVTIIALEITEIYKLNHYQFRAALQPCPRLKRRLLGLNDGDTSNPPPPPSPEPPPPSPPPPPPTQLPQNRDEL